MIESLLEQMGAWRQPLEMYRRIQLLTMMDNARTSIDGYFDLVKEVHYLNKKGYMTDYYDMLILDEIVPLYKKGVCI